MGKCANAYGQVEGLPDTTPSAYAVRMVLIGMCKCLWPGGTHGADMQKITDVEYRTTNSKIIESSFEQSNIEQLNSLIGPRQTVIEPRLPYFQLFSGQRLFLIRLRSLKPCYPLPTFPLTYNNATNSFAIHHGFLPKLPHTPTARAGMQYNKRTMKKITKNEMKKLMGGYPPGGITRKLWSCLTDPVTPWYDNVCYSVQPQPSCGYSQPCTQIGTCTSMQNMCIY